MKVLVLGAGVVGVTSAWYLSQAGHEVEVVDRQPAAGMETSFANGGQVAVSFAEPWANPAAPAKIIKWLGREDAPLLFRLRLDWQQWRWALQFLRECTAARTRDNTLQILKLARYSLAALQRLRAATAIEYDQVTRGILNFYTSQAELDHAAQAAQLMREFGVAREVLGAQQCVALEPALRACRELAGGIYTTIDESGDAHRFTQELARRCAARGVRFRYDTHIARLDHAGGQVTGVRVIVAQSQRATLEADAYVVALGSETPQLLRPLGVNIALYPVKGYSATLQVLDAQRAPTISLTDEAYKLVFSRFGDRLRVAGTAELNGYNIELNQVRLQALLQRTFALFPNALKAEPISLWAGLRPATPGNVPLIGRTRYGNLFLNTGHGTLGWTLACGSAQACADIISGRQPQVDFRFLQMH